MRIRHVNDPCLPAMIVTAKKIIVAARAEIAGGLARVAVQANVHALPHADAVVHPSGNGKRSDVFAIVELHKVNIRREKQLIFFIHWYGGIFPPKK